MTRFSFTIVVDFAAALFTVLHLKQRALVDVAAASRERLMARMSHEIRTPLSGVLRLVEAWAIKERNDVACYEPKYTFVEKLQAVVRKYRYFKESQLGATLPANFIRHYYDLYQLIDRPEIQEFIGSVEYEQFKKERFGCDDTKIGNSDAFRLSNPTDRTLFEREYSRSASLYFKGRPPLEEILIWIGQDIERL